MSELLSGALMAGYLVAGLHFLKFHRASGDRLFLIFAISFVLLAVQRVALVMLADTPEASIYLYAVRVFAFLLIIVGIVDKNRAAAA